MRAYEIGDYALTDYSKYHFTLKESTKQGRKSLSIWCGEDMQMTQGCHRRWVQGPALGHLARSSAKPRYEPGRSLGTQGLGINKIMGTKNEHLYSNEYAINIPSNRTFRLYSRGLIRSDDSSISLFCIRFDGGEDGRSQWTNGAFAKLTFFLRKIIMSQ